MTQTPDNSWQLTSEAILEDLVWQNLDALGLKPLARQHHLQSQVCDILASSSNQQMVVIELKNVEDRYLLPQLTRYYSAVVAGKAFENEVNYDLPIRLMAIAPSFHPHNLIDRDHSRLDFELVTFSVLNKADGFCLKLTDFDGQQSTELNIPAAFHPHLVTVDGDPAVSEPAIEPPPKSLSKLLEDVSDAQRSYVLDIRGHLLEFDARIIEVGRTTTTQYGLRKGQGICKTRVCAEFTPEFVGMGRPRLMLRLPHQKRKLMNSRRFYQKEPVKGLAWADVWRSGDELVSKTTQLFFFLGKSCTHYSKAYTLTEYEELYNKLTRSDRSFASVEDLVGLALEEWLALVEA